MSRIVFACLSFALLVTVVDAGDVRRSQAVLRLEERFRSRFQKDEQASMRVAYVTDPGAKAGLFVFQTAGDKSPRMLWLGAREFDIKTDPGIDAWMSTLLGSYEAWRDRTGIADLVPTIPASEDLHFKPASEMRECVARLEAVGTWRSELRVIAAPAGTWGAVILWQAAPPIGCRQGMACLPGRVEAVRLECDTAVLTACDEFLRTQSAAIPSGPVHAAIGVRGVAMWTAPPPTGSIATFDVQFAADQPELARRFLAGVPAASGFRRIGTDRLYDIRQRTPWSTAVEVRNATDSDLLSTIVCRDAELRWGVNVAVWFLE